jgi:hypothetical protein
VSRTPLPGLTPMFPNRLNPLNPFLKNNLTVLSPLLKPSRFLSFETPLETKMSLVESGCVAGLNEMGYMVFVHHLDFSLVGSCPQIGTIPADLKRRSPDPANHSISAHFKGGMAVLEVLFYVRQKVTRQHLHPAEEPSVVIGNNLVNLEGAVRIQMDRRIRFQGKGGLAVTSGLNFIPRFHLLAFLGGLPCLATVFLHLNIRSLDVLYNIFHRLNFPRSLGKAPISAPKKHQGTQHPINNPSLIYPTVHERLLIETFTYAPDDGDFLVNQLDGQLKPMVPSPNNKEPFE